MSLMLVRVFQWLFGILLFVFGLYLIFGIQEFFGTLAIIAAFFIFPSLENKGKNSASGDDGD
jgi:predicted histidine transporter YuiF (NhaC family)